MTGAPRLRSRRESRRRAPLGEEEWDLIRKEEKPHMRTQPVSDAKMLPAADDAALGG
ncbi:hypothetical protein GCM10009837_86860 [Streptomyces durmitorensis]